MNLLNQMTLDILEVERVSSELINSIQAHYSNTILVGMPPMMVHKQLETFYY